MTSSNVPPTRVTITPDEFLELLRNALHTMPQGSGTWHPEDIAHAVGAVIPTMALAYEEGWLAALRACQGGTGGDR
jgi:hypothetical protein